MDLALARIDDDPGAGRHRVLVDALRPRGMRRDDAPIDEWRRAVAPSAELRKWYRHDPQRFAEFAEFAERYRRELGSGERAAAVAALLDRAREQPLTVVTATREVEISHAAVLLEVLRSGDELRRPAAGLTRLEP
ncbi:MAG TPA: DUF488 family protein [Jatrophihabitans sp.]|nr:DUF488 family protein [Jatrophihabitans sp.]